MKNFLIVSALVVIIALPFILRKEAPSISNPDEVLVLYSPHNEAIRYEIEEAFRAWYHRKTGKTVLLDWRAIGGTSEIARAVESNYIAAFRNLWEREMRQPWTLEVQGSFANSRVRVDDDSFSPLARRARATFLESGIGIGVDIFFGGGTFDHSRMASTGYLVDSGVLERHPDLFGEGGIPQRFAGEEYWDKGGRWVGVCLASFGITYNVDVIGKLGLEEAPASWRALADHRLLGEVGAADPSKSGSINKAFEMIIQQEMQKEVAQRKAVSPRWSDELEREAVATGWMEAMRLIQRIAGNARYFTDSASKPSLDVAMGDCAVGMSIDFYGRFQQENIFNRTGRERFMYVTPEGGSTVSADPISMFRGAPNEALAKDFIDFVMSVEGQRLWNYKVGTPGGPKRFALRRPPIRPDLYTENHLQYMSDPDALPYIEGLKFTYQIGWTGPLFNEIRYIIKVAFIDVHPELKEAWASLVEADFPPRATALFDDLEAISYENAWGAIRTSLRAGRALDRVKMAAELSDQFRQRYREVTRLAKAGE